MTGRPRRVPPPPPPGFGDEEYYALYGTPEQYQRYRRDLERATKEGSPGSPQHEEYYVYRRFRSHEESYDYYYGPRHGREMEGRRGAKRRIAPPPPPGFGDSPPAGPSRRRAPSPLPSTGDEESGEEDEGPAVFKNFKVTIKNGEEGTPSLSDSEEERGKSKKRRKRKKEREREKRKRLEKQLAKREEELKLLSKKRNISGGAVEEGEVKERKPRNIRDRLGERKEDVDMKWRDEDLRRGVDRLRGEGGASRRGGGRGSPGPSRAGPGPLGAAETRRQELLRRAEVRRQNKERSPIARADVRKRSPLRGRVGEASKRKGGKGVRSPSPKRRAGPRGTGRKRSVTPRGRPGPGEGKKRKRKRKRERDRERLRRRGGLAESEKKVLEEENASMRAKLADRLSKRKADEGGEAALQDRLAELAGQQAGAEEEGAGKEESRERSKSPGGRGGRGKMRSDQVQQEVREAASVSPGRKWKHDKFDKRSLRGRSSPDQKDEEFGDHWSKIKSEKDKEKGRKRSESRSRSRSRRRKRSWSKSKSSATRRKRSSSRGKKSRSRGGGRSKSKKRSNSRRRRKPSGRRKSRSSSKSRSRSRSRKSDSHSPVRSHKARRRRGKFSRSHSRSQSESSESSEASQSRSRSASNEKEGVNLGLSGALTEDANTVGGTVVKYSEPPEARKPRRKWRLYVFKGNEELPILYIHRQSAYLLGRDRKVADVPLDHPSCSKQHSALQFRLVPFTRPDGTQGRRVQLYIMDLGSANGTFVNNNKIDPSKYVQLLEKDVLKFGFSSREYVLLHDQSKEEEEDLGVD